MSKGTFSIIAGIVVIFSTLLPVQRTAAGTILPTGQSKTTEKADTTAEADISTQTDTTTSANQSAHYFTLRGTIDNIENVSAGITRYSIGVKSPEGESIIYHIYDKTLLFDLDTLEAAGMDSLQEGMEVSAFYGVNTPVSMSEPPQINPEILVIYHKDSTGKVKAEYFDRIGLSADGHLKLNLSDDTLIVNERGERLRADAAKNQNLLVFYDLETKSTPPQTSPEKVVVLDAWERELVATEAPTELSTKPSSVADEQADRTNPWATIMENLAPEATYRQEQTIFVRLRDLSSHLGFELIWDNNSRSVTLTKGNETYLLTIDQAEFSHNQTMKTLWHPAFIREGRTFVEEGFISQLLGEQI